MDIKENKQEADAIRKQFAKRKSECVDISVKIKQSIEVLEAVLKMDDVDGLNENGLGKFNVHDFVWNILIWYPRQAAPFFVRHITPLYHDALQNLKPATPFVNWLSNHTKNARLFRFLLRLFPKSAAGDILRIRSANNALSQLTRLQEIYDEQTDGQPINTNLIARFVSYLHILHPTKTSEIVRFTLELYKECEKINANQIAGFSALSKKQKQTPKVSKKTGVATPQ